MVISEAVICHRLIIVLSDLVDSATGATVRGCTKELEGYSGCPVGDGTCVDCDRHYCNAATIPWWRVKCHQCEGTECMTTSITTAKYCDTYQDNEQCYSVLAYVNNEIQVYRGCMSDAANSPGKQLCDSEGDNCAKCTGTECNRQELKTNGHCYFCEYNDPNCATLEGVSSIYCPAGDQVGCFHSTVGEFN